jgi:hypothetical protein
MVETGPSVHSDRPALGPVIRLYDLRLDAPTSRRFAPE